MRGRTGLALGVLLLVATTACGSDGGGATVASANGSGKPTSSAGTAGAGAGKSAEDQALTYAKCMREHGVSNFSDPEPGESGGFKMMLPEGVTPEGIKGAEDACKNFLPTGGDMKKGEEDPKVTDQLRKYAQCMRDNGVPRYPDPGFGGAGPVKRDESLYGMDPRDPKFKAAEQACASLRPNGPGMTGGAPSGNGAKA